MEKKGKKKTSPTSFISEARDEQAARKDLFNQLNLQVHS